MSNVTPGQEPFILDGVLYNRDADVAAWMEDRLDPNGGADINVGQIIDVPFRALGILPDASEGAATTTKFIGGAYFFNQENNDIWAAVVSDTPDAGHPKVIARILDYPFRMLNIPRISVQIAKANERAVRQAQGLGFVIEGEPRGKGVLYLGLLRSDAQAKGFWKPDLPMAV